MLNKIDSYNGFKFTFSNTGCRTKAKEPSFPNYLPITIGGVERRDGSIKMKHKQFPKTEVLLSCRPVRTTVWLHHLNSYEMSGEKDENYKRMLHAVFIKSRKQQLSGFNENSTRQNSSCTTTYFPSHKSSKKDKQDMLGISREVSDVLLWSPTHWLTSKHLQSSALYGHLVPSRVLAESNE